MLTLKTNLKHSTGLVACVLSLQTAVQALSLAMCSSENTGTSNLQSTYQFNSNGYCHDKCDGYAYAIVQGESCWCSNSAPGDTTSLSECDVACPGFGYEYCGDSSKGVFGYIALGSASTGSDGSSTGGYSSTENGYSSSENGGSSTENGDSSTETGESSTEGDESSTEGDESSTANGYSSTADASTSTSTEKAVVKTTFSSAKATLSSSKTTFSGAETSSGQTGASSAAESTAASSVSPVVSTFYSVATMTGDSQKTVTRTLLQTLTAASSVTAPGSSGEARGEAPGSSGATAKSSGGFFSSTGRVAGVFTAVGVVAVAVLAGLFFFLRRKISGYRAAHNTYYRYSDEGGSPFGDDAESNVMPRLDYSDLESNAHQHDYPEKQDVSAGSSSGGFVVDPRLDPDGPLYRSAGDDYSNRSLSDDIDYSRKVLKVTNA